MSSSSPSSRASLSTGMFSHMALSGLSTTARATGLRSYASMNVFGLSKPVSCHPKSWFNWCLVLPPTPAAPSNLDGLRLFITKNELPDALVSGSPICAPTGVSAFVAIAGSGGALEMPSSDMAQVSLLCLGAQAYTTRQ